MKAGVRGWLIRSGTSLVEQIIASHQRRSEGEWCSGKTLVRKHEASYGASTWRGLRGKSLPTAICAALSSLLVDAQRSGQIATYQLRYWALPL